MTTYARCWEQKTFQYITTPFDWIMVIGLKILRPIYWVMIITVLPMMLLLFLMELVWLPCAIIISLFARLSRRFKGLRPFSFVLALPFLLCAYVVITLSPVPNAALQRDVEAKLIKLNYILSFPYGSLFGGVAG